MRFPLILFGVASAVWLAPAATLDAQRTETPVVARSAESRRAAAETFLDRRRPEAERLAAAPTAPRARRSAGKPCGSIASTKSTSSSS
jgi:hypothetical protein